MAPFYRGYDPAFNLDSDDIEAIQVRRRYCCYAVYPTCTILFHFPQALYGSNSGGDSDDDSTGQGSGKKTTTQEPPGTEGSDAELCTDTKVNTLFNSAEGETFVFKGELYDFGFPSGPEGPSHGMGGKGQGQSVCLIRIQCYSIVRQRFIIKISINLYA